MEAASEEVQKALEKAGQQLSFEGKPVHLSQMQLNDLPVLGGLPVRISLPCPVSSPSTVGAY